MLTLPFYAFFDHCVVTTAGETEQEGAQIEDSRHGRPGRAGTRHGPG